MALTIDLTGDHQDRDLWERLCAADQIEAAGLVMLGEAERVRDEVAAESARRATVRLRTFR